MNEFKKAGNCFLRIVYVVNTANIRNGLEANDRFADFQGVADL